MIIVLPCSTLMLMQALLIVNENAFLLEASLFRLLYFHIDMRFTSCLSNNTIVRGFWTVASVGDYVTDRVGQESFDKKEASQKERYVC